MLPSYHQAISKVSPIKNTQQFLKDNRIKFDPLVNHFILYSLNRNMKCSNMHTLPLVFLVFNATFTTYQFGENSELFSFFFFLMQYTHFINLGKYRYITYKFKSVIHAEEVAHTKEFLPKYPV